MKSKPKLACEWVWFNA